MRLLTLLLCLSQLAHHVAASIAAGKYQWVFLWYSYRMNVEVFKQTGGEFPMLIAPGCMGSVNDGIPSCNLDEFLDQTYARPENPIRENAKTWTGITALSPTENTVEELATAIFNAGYGSAFVDPYVISPNDYYEGSNRGEGFVKIFQSVVNNVQQIRAERGDKLVQGELKACRTAMAKIIDGRFQENNDLLTEALEEVMDRAGFTVIYQDDGLIDFQATKATNGDDGVSWRDAVTRYVQGSSAWADSDKGEILLTHLHAFTNCQWFRDQLEAPAPC